MEESVSWKFDAMEELSGATDAANSWARDMGVPETESPAGLKALIYKLWDEAGLRLHRCLDKVQEMGLKLAEARKDSERLKWFLDRESDYGAFCEFHGIKQTTSRKASLDEWRAAIDAARERDMEGQDAS